MEIVKSFKDKSPFHMKQAKIEKKIKKNLKNNQKKIPKNSFTSNSNLTATSFFI